MHHYMTKYRDEDENEWYVSWLQFNLFGKAITFSERRYKNGVRQGK